MANSENGSGRSGGEGPGPAPTFDAYYKARLRAGFIDLRNSYNEKTRSRLVGAYSRRGPGYHDTELSLDRVHEGGGACEPMMSSSTADSQAYGSASSLDMASAVPANNGTNNTSGGDSFFTLLHEYRDDEEVGQRAAPPPHVEEALRGHVDVAGMAAPSHGAGRARASSAGSKKSKHQSMPSPEELRRLNGSNSCDSLERASSGLDVTDGAAQTKPSKSNKNKPRNKIKQNKIINNKLK